MTFVIVGGGLAGAKAAETLRDEGFDGPIVLVCAEAERPYERPPLSKGYMLGSDERDSAFVHPESWYPEHDVDLRLGTRATALDPAAHQVDLDGVLYLRELPDADRIKSALGEGRRIAVVGAGWIGLEIAAAARHHGAEVTVIEVAQLPLQRVLGDEVATVFADLHREHDVDLRLGSGVGEIRGEGGRASSLVTTDGDEIAVDAVVVGVGITPATALGEAAGLRIEDGIAVDAGLRTSAPDVYAAGDVAAAEHPRLGIRVRVEHWANALKGGPAAARSMLGQDVSYDELPFFFTDQYDLGMEYVGHAPPGGYDRGVTRGDVRGREFQAFWLRDGRSVAAMHVNLWDDGVAPLEELVRSGRVLDPERLADPSVPLDDV